MERTRVKETINKVDQEIKLIGWAHQVRKMGKILFLILRDTTGIVQVVFAEDALRDEAEKIKAESVIEIVGTVKKRPENMINPEMATGTIEVEANELKILAESEVLPFIVDQETDVSEEMRLKYRYLDLRRERLHTNIKKRHQFIKFIRDFLSERDFVEIETPILTVATPEGARDYLVPSRIYPGRFFALPQSPQQYKQLLMVAGFERYFQIARCFRDEDTRGDRQPEFTQLDLEMSFATPDEILSLTEELFTSLVEKLYPQKKITQKPWPRISYSEAMEKYGSDKPDLRKNKEDPSELAFCYVVDFPLFERDEKGKPQPTHHPFTAPLSGDIALLDENPLKVRSQAYDMVLNGVEIGSGSIRIINPNLQVKIFEILGISEKEAKEKFGHLLEAFKYGAPPHGGIAPGLDRILMILQDEPNIREVIAFPKTTEARDPMTGAPKSPIPEQLSELGLQIKKKKIR